MDCAAEKSADARKQPPPFLISKPACRNARACGAVLHLLFTSPPQRPQGVSPSTVLRQLPRPRPAPSPRTFAPHPRLPASALTTSPRPTDDHTPASPSIRIPHSLSTARAPFADVGRAPIATAGMLHPSAKHLTPSGVHPHTRARRPRVCRLASAPHKPAKSTTSVPLTSQRNRGRPCPG